MGKIKIRFCGDKCAVYIFPVLAFSNRSGWCMYIGWANLVWKFYLEDNDCL